MVRYLTSYIIKLNLAGNGVVHSSTNSPLISRPSSNSLNRNGLQVSSYANNGSSADIGNNNAAVQQQNNLASSSNNLMGGGIAPALTGGSTTIGTLQSNAPTGIALFKQMDYMIYGKYKLLDKLGSGSFGEIYSGISVTDGEKVAIKLVSRDIMTCDYDVMGFIRHVYVISHVIRSRYGRGTHNFITSLESTRF